MRKILFMGLFSFFGFNSCTTTKNPSFSQQIQVFEGLGFNLNSGTTNSDVERWLKQNFLDEPFSLMYITLGQTIEREPWTPLTNKCWDFDTEAIEGHGSYIEIMKNLERITRGELNFENIKDYVDIEERIAWVSFNFKEQEYKWDLEIDDDWVDPVLFTKIVELTQINKTKGKYTVFETGGQDIVFGFETPESLKEIKRKTGLNISWL
jgi:hypothetical protein